MKRVAKTPERIKAILKAGGKRATNAQIAAYCSKPGRPFVDAARLAAHLKTLEEKP